MAVLVPGSPQRLRRAVVGAARAFTIVELLVVLGILALLTGLSLPAVQTVRESARALTCQSHLRQWAIGSLAYEGVEGVLPGPWFSAPPGPAMAVRDRGLLGPLRLYVGEGMWPSTGRVDASTFDWENRADLPLRDGLLNCPSGSGPAPLTDLAQRFSGPATPGLRGTTCDYIGNAGCRNPKSATDPGAPEFLDGSIAVAIRRVTSPVRLANITDGLSHTFLMWESSGGAIVNPGTANRSELAVDPNAIDRFGLVVDSTGALVYFSVGKASSKSYLYSWAGLRLGNASGPGAPPVNYANTSGEPFSRHPGACAFAMVDGSVRMLGSRVSWEAVQHAATASCHDGEF